MGRVRKYKKLKSCDPFFRGPKNINKGLNLPPSRKHDQFSNSFRYFQEQTTLSSSNNDTVKKENPSNSETKKSKKRKSRITDHTSNDLTKVVGQEPKQCKDEIVFSRLKGESGNHFLARVNIEANEKLISVQKKVGQSSDKRKRYNKERKLKYQLRKLGVNLEDAEGMDFKDLKDHISFGEVVKRPPDLKPSNSVRNAKTKCTVTEEEREKVIDLYRQHVKQEQAAKHDDNNNNYY